MNGDGGCLAIIIGAILFIGLVWGMCWLSMKSYDQRRADCKAQGGQWIAAMKYDDSKCIERAEK